jgi:hypothetical protein
MWSLIRQCMVALCEPGANRCCGRSECGGGRRSAAVRQRAAEHVNGIPVSLIPLLQPLLLEFLVDVQPWEILVVGLARPLSAHVAQVTNHAVNRMVTDGRPWGPRRG